MPSLETQPRPRRPLSLDKFNVLRQPSRQCEFIYSNNLCHFIIVCVTEVCPYCGTRWKYTLDLKWSDQKGDWEFVDSEMISDQQIELSDTAKTEVENLIENIFQQLDFYDYLDANELKSLQLLEQLRPVFREQYMQYHSQFKEEGLFQ